MRERPIIFSGPMVRAILDGRKTQTRRIIKRGISDVTDAYRNPALCPYAKPGDRLWVRERWAVGSLNDPDPPRDIPLGTVTVHYEASGEPNHRLGVGRWRQGMFMPRWASWITLEVTGVRVERLQDISAKDIISEGAVARAHDDQFGHNPVSAFDGHVYMDLRSLWAYGWDSINRKRAPWSSNPWVWVLEFTIAAATPT